jgi:exodeoxyribonuclease VII large subunit
MAELVKSVDLLTAEIKARLEGDLRGLWVEGEVSGSRINAPSGHAYFTLKGSKSLISCVMFRSDIARQKDAPQDGNQLQVYGDVRVYEPQGKYQFYVRSFRTAGQGDLFLEFERLKQKLQQEGIFDAERKRELPRLPLRVGVVTSLSGAALHDIIKVAWSRFPGISLVVAPAQVQGADAPRSLIVALESLYISTWPVDVIIIGRGGGSFEDLWAFNDEALVRTIATCPIPIISAVGHETDYSLSDFVADARAATPSAAAQLAVPEQDELHKTISLLVGQMEKSCRRMLEQRKTFLSHLDHRLGQVHPLKLWQNYSQQLDDVNTGLNTAIFSQLRLGHERLEKLHQRLLRQVLSRRIKDASLRAKDLEARLNYAARQVQHVFVQKLAQQQRALEALNPLGVLRRGYAICYQLSDGVGREKILHSTRFVRPGNNIKVILGEGELIGKVEEVLINDK